jgi:hypothetical protein
MHASAVCVLEPGNAGAPRGGPGSGGQLERLAGRRRAVGDQMHHRSAHGRVAEEWFDVPGLLGHHHDALPARDARLGIADAECLALERGASGRADVRAAESPQLAPGPGSERREVEAAPRPASAHPGPTSEHRWQYRRRAPSPSRCRRSSRARFPPRGLPRRSTRSRSPPVGRAARAHAARIDVLHQDGAFRRAVAPPQLVLRAGLESAEEKDAAEGS